MFVFTSPLVFYSVMPKYDSHFAVLLDLEVLKMAKILKIGSSDSGKSVQLTLLFGEEKRVITVSENIYRGIGLPLVGDELDGEELEMLLRESELREAELRALRLLEYSDASEAELKRKLRARGISREAAEAAAEKMVALGYINEERHLRDLIEREANSNLRGPKRIAAKLVSRGYSPSKISAAMNELVNEGRIDFKENARRLIEKKGSALSREEIKKLLYTNGYK